MKRKFSKAELLDLNLPFDAPDGGEIVKRAIISKTRWSIRYRLVFRLADQPRDEAWQVFYSVGATEYQDERPWDNEDDVEAVLVRPVQKTVTVWEEVQQCQ